MQWLHEGNCLLRPGPRINSTRSAGKGFLAGTESCSVLLNIARGSAASPLDAASAPTDSGLGVDTTPAPV